MTRDDAAAQRCGGAAHMTRVGDDAERSDAEERRT